MITALNRPLSAEAQVPFEDPAIVLISNFIDHVNPQLPGDLERQYAEAVLNDAQAAHVDPCLLLAIVSVESHWKANAISQHGAVGLGQLMPRTAQGLNVDPASPFANLFATAQYLHFLLGRFSSAAEHERIAIAAYNAGPNAIIRNHARLSSTPTSNYVREVIAFWHKAQDQLGQLTLTATVPDEPAFVEQALNTTVAEASYWGSASRSVTALPLDQTLQHPLVGKAPAYQPHSFLFSP